MFLSLSQSVTSPTDTLFLFVPMVGVFLVEFMAIFASGYWVDIRPMATFSNQVERIVSFRSNKKMGWIKTWWIIAAVQDAQTAFQREAKKEVGRNSMNETEFAEPRNSPVPIYVAIAIPFPASRISYGEAW